MPRKVLSVGQCAADHGSIARFVKTNFDAEVIGAGTQEEALEKLRASSFDLVLVNRVFDRDGQPGLELIQQIYQDEQLKDTPVMLVSNYEDAQAEAVAAGALEGFGKSELGTEAAKEKLRGVLGPVP